MSEDAKPGSVRVELTYAMSKELGVPYFEVENAATVADVIAAARERFQGHAESFDQLARVAKVAVNGVLTVYRNGLQTPLSPGDRVAFVKAAAGG